MTIRRQKKRGGRMNYSENIRQALENFKKRSKNKNKTAFLFHNGEAFLFYVHKFIKINYAKLSLIFQNIRIEYTLEGNVIDDIFIWTDKEQVTIVIGEDSFVYCKNEKKESQLFKLALYYEIKYDKQEDCYLCGVVYVNSEISNKIHQIIFTEPKIKELFLLLIFKNKELGNNSAYETGDAEVLEELADKINRENIKAVSKVYLLGESNN